MKKILSQLVNKNKVLSQYWFHRVFSILLIFTFIFIVGSSISTYSSSDLFRGGSSQQWEEVGTLNDRITSDIKSIGGLALRDEKVGDKNRTYVLNDEPDEYYKGIINDVYCSKDLANKFTEVQTARNVNELYVEISSKRVKVTPETFSQYITQNNIQCLGVDAFTTWNKEGEMTGSLKFLEPKKTYQDDWSYYKKSPTKTFIYYIEMLLVIIGFSFVFLFGLVSTYQKIAFYMLFGNEKIDKHNVVNLESEVIEKTVTKSNKRSILKTTGIILLAFFIFLISFKIVKIIFYLVTVFFLDWAGVSVEDSIEMATGMGDFSTLLLLVIIVQKTRKVLAKNK